jgi:hypothetical protein
MTKWIDQKSIETHIICCAAWQSVLDELERPESRLTPRDATSVLKKIANEYMRIRQEIAAVGPSSCPSYSSSQIIGVACEDAVEAIRRKAA